MEHIIKTIKKGNITNEIAAQLYSEYIYNYDIIRLLLHNNIYQNYLLKNKRYPINYCNNIDIYKLLYLNDKPDYLIKTLLYCNNIDILHFLLEKGAIIDNFYFMNTKNIKIIEYILQNKLTNELDDNILIYENSITKIELYIKYNNIDKNILLDDTILNNLNYNAIKILLDNNVNIKDDILFYILFDINNDSDIKKYHKKIELFLNKGININYVKDGLNLLFYTNGDDDTYYENILFFIKKGINIHHKNNEGNTALFEYCIGGEFKKEIIDLYILHGLSLNELDKYNRNILFYQNYSPIIDDIILNYKINVNIKDIYGDTILHYILKEQCYVCKEYIEIIIKYMNVNELNSDNNTILHLLCENYDCYEIEEFNELSELLINEYNSNIYQENNEGLTPYDILLKSDVELDDKIKLLYTEIKSNTKSSNKIL